MLNAGPGILAETLAAIFFFPGNCLIGGGILNSKSNSQEGEFFDGSRSKLIFAHLL